MNQFPWSTGPTMFPSRGIGSSSLRIGGIAGLVIALVGVVVVLVMVARVHSSVGVSPNGPCVGGPAPGAAGQPIGQGNYSLPCADGGTTIVHLGN